MNENVVVVAAAAAVDAVGALESKLFDSVLLLYVMMIDVVVL
jgi:hypothetical protein